MTAFLQSARTPSLCAGTSATRRQKFRAPNKLNRQGRQARLKNRCVFLVRFVFLAVYFIVFVLVALNLGCTLPMPSQPNQGQNSQRCQKRSGGFGNGRGK